MNGIKLERVAPNQEQVARQQDIPGPYKMKYRCKFCEITVESEMLRSTGRVHSSGIKIGRPRAYICY